MNTRPIILLTLAFLLVGLIAAVGCSKVDNLSNLQTNVAGIGDDIFMQDGGDGDVPAEGDEGGDSEDGTSDEDSEDFEDAEGTDDGEADSEDGADEEQPSEEEPAEEAPTDVIGMPAPPAGGTGDDNLQNALAGIADYTVSYDTTMTRQQLTESALRDLNVTYAGDESPVAIKTKAILELDLLESLSNLYGDVEEEFAADPDEDYAPDDPDNTFNYLEPRDNPFVIPNLIPDELRPELEGTGLDGAVDPEVLNEIFWAQYAANLRLVPIIVIGTLEAGQNRGCIYTIAGAGFTRWLEEGRSHCLSWGASFSLTCSQVSEDFVVLVLRGTYDRGCRYAATESVVRTFHVSSN